MNTTATKNIIAGLFLCMSGIASSQTIEALQKEINALKITLTDLTNLVKKNAEANEAKQDAPAQGELVFKDVKFDPEDFERIKAKAEGLEDLLETQGLKGLKFSGAFDPTFVSNRRQNAASFAFLNHFDGRDRASAYAYDNSFFGLGLLDIQKETQNNTKFRLTLAPGKSAGSITNLSSIVHEASVSIPMSDLQTRFIAGQMPDFSGYEPFFSHQQPLISHNMLFDFTAPAFYAGAGVELLRGKWLSKALITNMNYSRYGTGNKTPAIAYRVDYAKGEFKGFGFSGQKGQFDGNQFSLFETDGYYIRGDLTLQGEIASGSQDKAAFNGGKAKWTGVSGLLGYRFMPRFQFTVRADAINNQANGGGLLGSSGISCANAAGAFVQVGLDCRNGFGPGMTLDPVTKQWGIGNPNQGTNRQAISTGISYLIGPSLTLKAEYRVDRASAAVFIDMKDGSFKTTNTLLLTSLVATF